MITFRWSRFKSLSLVKPRSSSEYKDLLKVDKKFQDSLEFIKDYIGHV